MDLLVGYYGTLGNVRLILRSMIDNKTLDISLMAAIIEYHMEVALLLVRDGANVHLIDYIDLLKELKYSIHDELSMRSDLSMEKDIISSY